MNEKIRKLLNPVIIIAIAFVLFVSGSVGVNPAFGQFSEYNHVDFPISIFYPSSWTVYEDKVTFERGYGATFFIESEEKSFFDAIMNGDSSESLISQVSFPRYVNNPDFSVEDYTKETCPESKSDVCSIEALKSKNIEIDQKKGFFVKYDRVGENGSEIHWFLFLKNDDHPLFISGSARPNQLEKIDLIEQSILLTCPECTFEEPHSTKNIRIYVEPLPDYASNLSNVVYLATQFWKEQDSDLEFHVAETPEQSDVSIKWIKDFGGNQLGHALGSHFIQVGLGDSRCDDKWNQYSSEYVSKIVTHELGHTLGDNHSLDPNSIMAPIITGAEYENIDGCPIEKPVIPTLDNVIEQDTDICGEGMFSKEGVCTAICGDGTIFENGKCKLIEVSTPNPSSQGGGCLIATATYGSELAPQVQQLRELRDNQLLSTQSGTSFMNTFNQFYYSFSPIIADYERENPMFKEMVKIAITPMISSLSILNYVDMDSEESVLGYGISLIVLNGLMYVGIPIAGIILIRKRF